MNDMTFLFSGLLGAIIGVFSTWLLSWRKNRYEARAKFGMFLIRLEDQLYRENKPGYEILSPKYDELLELAWHAASFSPLQGKAIIEQVNELRGNSPGLPRPTYCFSPDKKVSRDIVEKLLLMLKCPYPNGKPPLG